jgi:hypothetical protein
MSSRLRIVITITAAIMTASIAPAFAFDLGRLLNNTHQPENFKVIRVQALASMIADSNSHVNIYDANGWGLRTRAGIIPGAHLLTSDDKYDTAKELPSDKSAKLVFYCADLH